MARADAPDKKSDKARFAKNLELLRRSRDMTQEQLAEQVGRSRQAIIAWENPESETVPGERQLDRLSEIFMMPKSIIRYGDVFSAQQILPATNGHPTPKTVRERGPEWTPNPALANKLPRRAYEAAIDYCRRLARAGIPVENIEEAERLMIDGRYAQMNRRKGIIVSDDDWITTIDATWDIIREAAAMMGVKV